ncbi:MAG TPA: DUF5667 domain-containing protein [Actinomycetota bacterium]|nr:DUF5667 domain-containing protein [Actinomycetota bacterium]
MPYTIAEEQVVLASALDDAALTPPGEIRTLVRLARSLRAVPDPEIDPAFAARLEARLLTEGLDELSARRRPVLASAPKVAVSPVPHAAPVVALPRGRFVVRKAVIGLIAAAMLFALPVVSAGSALPGSPLYGVKTAKERIELALARGPVDRGFVHLRHAKQRLDEVEQLIVTRREGFVPSTLGRYDHAIDTGTHLILSATGDPAALARLAAEIRRGTGSLSQLLDVASPVVAPAIIESIATGGKLSLRVRLALGDVGTNVPVTPAAALPDSAGRVTAGSSPVVGGFGGAAPAPAARPEAPDAPIEEGPPGDDDEGPNSRGAFSSCLGMHVSDPTGRAGSACGVAVSIRDLIGSGHDTRPGESAVSGCPAATTCGVYALDRHRWPTSAGIATLSFVVNPVQPWVTPSEAVAAAVAAARAWSDANPMVRVDYRGTTTALPALGDGVNQIGWGNPGATNAVAQANILRVGDRVIEADIVLTASLPWATSHSGAVKRYDIRSVLTHEFGHWLGLDHLEIAAASEQSMFSRPRPGDARGATLALGDVRAIRVAYPCRGCAMPAISADDLGDGDGDGDDAPPAPAAQEPSRIPAGDGRHARESAAGTT